MSNIYKIINTLGIIAFVLVFIVFLLGITQSSYYLHYYTAILAFVFACLHLGFISYRNYKRKKGR
jgi:uncharacterized membrane protein YkgB